MISQHEDLLVRAYEQAMVCLQIGLCHRHARGCPIIYPNPSPLGRLTHADSAAKKVLSALPLCRSVAHWLSVHRLLHMVAWGRGPQELRNAPSITVFNFTLLTIQAGCR